MTEYKMLLGGTDIRTAAGRIEGFLTEEGFPRRDALRLRLTMEELLLRIRDARGRNMRCVLSLGRRLGRPHVQLSYAGEAFDPTVIYRESDGEAWSERLLTGIGVVPAWSWRRGINRLTLTPPKTPRFVPAGCAAALLLAPAFCAGARGTARAEELCAGVLTPVCDLFLGAAGCFAGLLLFFSVVCGICGAAGTACFGRIGRTVTRRSAGLTLLWSAAGCVTLALFRFPYPEAPRGGAARILSLLCAAVPRDPVTPFLEGNFGQILFLALLSAAALPALGERAGRMREWADQCLDVLLAVLERVCALLPLYVFAAVLRELLSGFPLPRMGTPLAVCLPGGLLIVCAKLLRTAFALKVSPLRLARLLLPGYLRSLSASSSAAVFGPAMDTCERELGIAHPLVLLGLPVGNLLCAPTATLCFASAALYLAGLYAVPVDIAWIVSLSLLGALMSMLLPPFPGAFLVCSVILLPQLGIPAEGMAVVAALSVFIDALNTANRSAYLQLELAMQAKRLGLLNEAALNRLR